MKSISKKEAVKVISKLDEKKASEIVSLIESTFQRTVNEIIELHYRVSKLESLLEAFCNSDINDGIIKNSDVKDMEEKSLKYVKERFKEFDVLTYVKH